MAHELHEHDHMVSVGGKVPWHGLVTVVNEAGISGMEATKLAKMDWEVLQAPVYFEYNDQYYETDKSRLVNYRILPDGRPYSLGIVSNSYHILQNIDCTRILDDALPM